MVPSSRRKGDSLHSPLKHFSCTFNDDHASIMPLHNQKVMQLPDPRKIGVLGSKCVSPFQHIFSILPHNVDVADITLTNHFHCPSKQEAVLIGAGGIVKENG